jgi:hypothetical protein
MDTTAENLLKGMEELSSMFKARMTEFERSLQPSTAKEASPTVRSLAAEYSSFKTFVWKSLNILKSQVDLVMAGLDRLDMHSRRKVLLFHGITEDNKEDVTNKILAIFSGQMNLPLSTNAIEVCHRLGANKKGARPVLVRFSTSEQRRQVWKSKTSLKGSKVSVSEFLTKARQEVFVAARGHFGVSKCWSADGTIVILLPDNSRRKIFTMGELRQLIDMYPQRMTEAIRKKI